MQRVAQQAAELSSAQSQLGEREGKLQAATAEIQALQQRAEEAENGRASLQTAISQKEELISGLQVQMHSLMCIKACIASWALCILSGVVLCSGGDPAEEKCTRTFSRGADSKACLLYHIPKHLPQRNMKRDKLFWGGCTGGFEDLRGKRERAERGGGRAQAHREGAEHSAGRQRQGGQKLARRADSLCRSPQTARRRHPGVLKLISQMQMVLHTHGAHGVKSLSA